MRPSVTEKENTCEHCNKPLFGRTDKRFCNDTCRNTFNRIKGEKEKLQANENIPEVFRIIKKNYEILQQFSPDGIPSGERKMVLITELIQLGFNPKFHTSIWQDGDAIWKFCFEKGWGFGEPDAYLIERTEQADLTVD
ncbi:hypothetical protein [Mucilaginibacter polytrichastri]|uniref:DUF2116 family Zn-ribbon domain-containing protein n=1 Tax=Mucilaginibacter polytrichastri TaxID=1302689 RepID=A0A1Q5ZWJ3_9SPHI|nr:hypothetical protein [Mucilaginibacter polytrichastri]OKS86116.1 hypothetical protein RG47T_1566 [Mucilaginibacter polytrichastri]SFS58568.1 hypothetical protein SAMN04487890_10225 [Mucilaginibacter polytrichastri]